jgi:hypothetical protein
VLFADRVSLPLTSRSNRTDMDENPMPDLSTSDRDTRDYPPTIAGAFRGHRRSLVVRPEVAADVDDLHVLDDGGCPTDPKGAWADVEENMNAYEQRNHDQSWSPSRAVMSMTCRQTTVIIDPAVRMVSTMCELFLQVLAASLQRIPGLSSPRIASPNIYSKLHRCLTDKSTPNQ